MKLFTLNKNNKGFTLIEMMVIAPIVILSIGAFIAVIVNLTGEVLSSRGSNVLAYDVQDTLNRMEEDIKLSSAFLATNTIKFSGTNPQGYGAAGSTTDFTNIGGASGNSLILAAPVTNGNPLSTSTGIVYLANQPNNCSDPISYSKNNPMVMNIIYFVDDNNTLWRRTVMPADYDNANIRCGNAPWQQPSCQEGYSSSFCKTNDVKLINGVTKNDLIIQYFASANSTIPNPIAGTAPDAPTRENALKATPTVSVSINAKTTIAGRNVERSATLRATRLDTNATAVNIVTAPTTAPSRPILASVVSNGKNVEFTWPRVNGATSYSFEYRINGADWIMGNDNINNETRTFTVTSANHTDTVEGRAVAKNSFGDSPAGTRSITIPLFAPLVLQNGWINYDTGYSTPEYTKTSAGVVVIKGLTRKTSATFTGEIIGTLPPGYRPSSRLIFGTTTSSNVTGRVDVLETGEIVIINGSTEWISLETIRFVPDGTYPRVNPTLGATFTNYGGGYAPASYVIDSLGRVNVQGLVGGNTYTNSTTIFNVPTDLSPIKYQHLPTRSDSFAGLGVGEAYPLVTKGLGTAYISLNTSWIPRTYTDSEWQNLGLINSWVHYGGSGGLYSSPQFTKSSDNLVTVKGLIGGGAAGSIIATLPEGYRPKSRILYTGYSADAHARIDILPNGQISFQTGSTIWFSLDGITFMAEQ